MRAFFALAAGAAILLGLPPAPSWAQAPTAPAIDENIEDDLLENDALTLPPQTVVGDPFGAGEVGADNTLRNEPVTTPTRTENPAGRVGGSLTVITAEQIEAGGQNNVADVLRGVPGLDVVRTGPSGGLTSVFLRGANSQDTRVLLDGIPLNDPSSAARGFDFANLTVDNIERIEILRGPQGPLYGSNTAGGVINIVTRRGEGPMSARVSLQGGAFGSQREAVHVSGGSDLLNYSLSGSYFQQDGFSAASPRVGGIEADGNQLGVISGRLGTTIADRIEIDYIFRWTDARADIDDASFSLGSPPIDDPLRFNLTESFYNRIQLKTASADGMLEHLVAFNYTDYKRSDRDDFFPLDFKGSTRFFEYQSNLYVTQTNILSAGADYYDESAASLSAFGNSFASQTRAGVFVQDQFQIGERLFNTFGARWDDNNIAGPAKTYRATSAYVLDETGTTIRGSIGTSFRAPALAENLFAFGNPNLRPETSKGWDIGAEQRLLDGAVVLGATYFRNDFNNLILFIPLPPPVFGELQNVGVARAHGVELQGVVQISDGLTLTASYTRTDTLNIDRNAPLVRRPANKGSMRLTRTFYDGLASLSLKGVFVGSQSDTLDNSVRLSSYNVFYLSGQCQLTESLRLFGRIDNIFDEDYEVVTGYTTPQSSAYAGLEWRR